MFFIKEPIIFPDKDSVDDILRERVPNIAEKGLFKVCNFSGPGTTHADGCRTAIRLFEEAHPEYHRCSGLNKIIDKFRLGAAFADKNQTSVVIFLSTTSENEVSRLWKPLCFALSVGKKKRTAAE